MPTDDDGAHLRALVEVMRALLGPSGCPWDRAQTLESLRPFVVEEAYEVVDAIDRGAPDALREELGDLLLQVVFQSELAAQRGWFGIDDVVEAIRAKMVSRHPWVFGDAPRTDANGAVVSWEAIKRAEREREGEEGAARRGALSGVPRAMPGLLRALRVGEKASAVGYDWPSAAGAREKITEELREVDEAVERGDPARVEAELGDLLFAVVSFARKQGVDPEAALRQTLDRFSRRFTHAERAAGAIGKALGELDPAQLDALWHAYVAGDIPPGAWRPGEGMAKA